MSPLRKVARSRQGRPAQILLILLAADEGQELQLPVNAFFELLQHTGVEDATVHHLGGDQLAVELDVFFEVLEEGFTYIGFRRLEDEAGCGWCAGRRRVWGWVMRFGGKFSEYAPPRWV